MAQSCCVQERVLLRMLQRASKCFLEFEKDPEVGGIFRNRQLKSYSKLF